MFGSGFLSSARGLSVRSFRRLSNFRACVAFHLLVHLFMFIRNLYIGETGRRKEVRTGEHGGNDKESWIFKHSKKTKHPKAKDKNFKILGANYDNRRKRRIAEAMFIRDLKPMLNKKKERYKLILFAWTLRQHIWRQIENIEVLELYNFFFTVVNHTVLMFCC